MLQPLWSAEFRYVDGVTGEVWDLADYHPRAVAHQRASDDWQYVRTPCVLTVLLEIRTYRLRPGVRAEFHNVCLDQCLPVAREYGIDVVVSHHAVVLTVGHDAGRGAVTGDQVAFLRRHRHR